MPTFGDPGPKYKDLFERMDRTVYDFHTGERVVYPVVSSENVPPSLLGPMQSDRPHQWERITWAADPDGVLRLVDALIRITTRMRNAEDEAFYRSKD